MSTTSDTIQLSQLVGDFVQKVPLDNIEIYNEFSLQHELGIYLRGKLPGYKIQFERNISDFPGGEIDFYKKEIDIVVIPPDGGAKGAVELKFPRNGQVPESIFGFCKDVAFLEQLRLAGFTSTCFLVFADSHLFYSGRTEGIYGYFRAELPITGLIQKPTGARDAEISVKGSYVAKWNDLGNEQRYCLIDVTGC